jgi:hypothetical protein
VGRFKDALAVNVTAVAVDEAYLAETGELASATNRYGYYPHNLHFVLISAQMGGDGYTARDGRQADAALPMEMADMEGWLQYVKAAPWFAKVQYGDAAAVEALLTEPEPEADLALLKAPWHYARGEAAARLGRPEEARAEKAALAELDAATDWRLRRRGPRPPT